MSGFEKEANLLSVPISLISLRDTLLHPMRRLVLAHRNIMPHEEY